ncbi:MAG: carboxypeptidase regulatory-like domain-containing protein [Candidatus Eiseniibacteriota bacterium]
MNTKHLTPQELSAHQDGMLTGIQRARAEAHLATCALCRAALERSVGLEHHLAEQITQDPGENYFRDFASRIEARIHPAGAAKLGPKAPPGDGMWNWLNTPVGMSWAGAVAVLVVGAGVALITVRTISPTMFRSQVGIANRARTEEVAPPPAAGGAAIMADSLAGTQPSADQSVTPGADQTAAAPASGAEGTAGTVAGTQAPEEQAQSAPARASEVRPGPNGENIMVERKLSIAPAPAPPPPADLKPGVPVKVRKNVSAQPLAAGSAEPEPAAKSATKDHQELPVRGGPSPSAPGGTSRDEAASPPAVRLGNAPASSNQRCGAVRDGAGRPVVGAQLMLVETGSSAQSRGDGSFCLDVSSAAHTLVVMAVGFEAQRMTLDAAEGGPLTLTLRAVSVMGGAASGSTGTGALSPPAASRWVQKPGAGTTSGAAPGGAAAAPNPIGSTESFASLSDSVRVLTVKALQFESDAARSQSAEQYKLAGEEWQKVLKRTQDTPAENETRFRIAAAYYRAWQLEPTRSRSVIALEAISSFVLRAPAGQERDQATMWLGHLRWGDSKTSDK